MRPDHRWSAVGSRNRRSKPSDSLFEPRWAGEYVANVTSRSMRSGRPDYRFDATWSELDELCGVLELHEHFANLTLSLFLAVPFEGGETCWWWTIQDGAWIGEAHVGLA
jgi:hypothetical protein